MFAIVPLDQGSHSYAGTGYANPHAVTQIANGLSTTTYSYDNNGNLTQKTTDGVTTTYMWDYANRLIALGSAAATTTYGFDPFVHASSNPLPPPRRSIPSSGTPSPHPRAAELHTRPPLSTSGHPLATHCLPLLISNSRVELQREVLRHFICIPTISGVRASTTTRCPSLKRSSGPGNWPL